MSDFARKPEESAAGWVERLGRISTSGLSAYVLSVLGSWKRDAAETAAAARPAPAARPAASVPGGAKAAAPPTPPLDAAKRAARALSAQDLAQFTFWLTHGRAD